jgi:hypothetical protein
MLVVRGERGLVKVRLSEVEAECAKNPSEREDEHPARPRRAPCENDVHNGDDCRNAERDGRQRDAQGKPDAKKQTSVNGIRGITIRTILSQFSVSYAGNRKLSASANKPEGTQRPSGGYV